MVSILDHRGNPIRTADLQQPQTAGVVTLRHEFAEHPSRGLTPAKLARILDDAEMGDLLAQCDLGDDIEEKDAHVFAELSKRKRALLGLAWDIVPPRNPSADEEKASALVKELLEDVPDFEDVIFDMADAILKAFACSEIAWGRTGKTWLPTEITLRAQRWFTVHRENRNELRLRDGSADGAELQPFGWIVHTHRARSGYIARAGLQRVLAWPYLFKNYSIRDLAEFLEIYGLPLRLGTYPRGASDKEKATLLQAVMSIGHDAGGIVPEGMKIEFQEAAQGQKDPFEAMIDWCERSESKAILGATLTSQTDSGSGAFALGQVHANVMRDIVVSDARQIAASITRYLVYPLAALNAAGITDPSRSPRFAFDCGEPEDLAQYAEALPKLVDIGLQVPVKWAQERLRIPPPEQGEAVLGRVKPPTTEPEPAPAPPALRAKPRTAVAALRAALDAAEADPVAALTEQLGARGAPLIDRLLEPVRRAVDEAASLEDLRDRIAALYPQMDATELAELLGLALAAANLQGRDDVETGVR